MQQSFSPYHFQGQHESEVVLRIIHRHWFNIAMHFFSVIVLSAVFLGVLGSLPIFFSDMLSSLPPSLIVFGQTLFFLLLWIYAFLVWIDYYFDVWVITNERIVNIEQCGLFTRRVSELKLNRVQDVTASVSGLIETMLNFGNVQVQTAGEEEHFVFRQVPDPYAIKDAVMRLTESASGEDLRAIAKNLRVGKSTA